MTIAEALREGIREEMRRDPSVFCLGEDIGVPGGFGGAFTVTLGLSEEFGHDRILDTPISEAGFAGVAIGAAMTGMRPIADVQYGALSPVGEVPDEEYLVPICKGAIRREGRDVTIVGKLLTVYRALGAAERLAKEGIDAEVIDPRTLVPLDTELILESVRKTGR